MRRLRAKNRAFTLKRIALIVLIIAALAGAAVGVSALLKERDSFGTVMDMPFYSETEYALAGGGVYYVENMALLWQDLANPENKTSAELGAEGVSIASSGALTAIWSGSSVQIIGVPEVIDVGGAVLGLRCGAGCVAVMRQDASGAVAALVYDAAGTLIDTIEAGSMMLVDCGFSGSSGSDVLWTLTLDTSGTAPVNTFTTYTYSKDDSGAMGATMSGVLSVRGQLAEEVVFTGSSIFVSGTSQLIRCDVGISSEAWRVLTYGYEYLDSSSTGAKPLFVFLERGAEGLSEVKLYSVSEGETADATARLLPLPEGTSSVVAAKGRLYAFAMDTMYVYSADGRLSASYPLGFSCNSAEKLSDSSIMIESNGAMKLLTIK